MRVTGFSDLHLLLSRNQISATLKNYMPEIGCDVYFWMLNIIFKNTIINTYSEINMLEHKLINAINFKAKIQSKVVCSV